MQGKKRLEGAKFILLDHNRKEIMCVKTDANGEALIDSLPYGKYILIEAEPPLGYHRFDQEIEILINDTCPDRCVEVINSQCLGSLKIIKCSN